MGSMNDAHAAPHHPSRAGRLIGRRLLACALGLLLALSFARDELLVRCGCAPPSVAEATRCRQVER